MVVVVVIGVVFVTKSPAPLPSFPGVLAAVTVWWGVGGEPGVVGPRRRTLQQTWHPHQGWPNHWNPFHPPAPRATMAAPCKLISLVVCTLRLHACGGAFFSGPRRLLASSAVSGLYDAARLVPPPGALGGLRGL